MMRWSTCNLFYSLICIIPRVLITNANRVCIVQAKNKSLLLYVSLLKRLHCEFQFLLQLPCSVVESLTSCSRSTRLRVLLKRLPRLRTNYWAVWIHFRVCNKAKLEKEQTAQENRTSTNSKLVPSKMARTSSSYAKRPNFTTWFYRMSVFLTNEIILWKKNIFKYFSTLHSFIE